MINWDSLNQRSAEEENDAEEGIRWVVHTVLDEESFEIDACRERQVTYAD